MNSRTGPGRILSQSRGPGRGRIPCLVLSAMLAVAVLVFIGDALIGQAADENPAVAAPRSPIELDFEKQELRIPCRFVNPSRVLEVFACHRNGPTHETVVEFDITGPELYQALLDLGCRPGSSWNITSPTDFLQTQGDRILVEVRWKHKERTREYPAEGLLHDGEFGFPAFVRGFSFDVRKPVEANDPGRVPGTLSIRAEIPEVVEVTLGGTGRQSPSYSLLRHPTTSARLERWMLPPVVNSDVVEDLPGLVEHQIPAVLILRRLSSERELITYLRSVAARRGVEDRLPVYDRVEPIAGEIDVLKKQLRDLAVRLEKLIGRSDDDGAKQTVELLRHGRWLVERIEASYLAMYEIQEDFKPAWMRQRKDIPAPLVEEANVLVSDGFKFEPRLAGKRVELAQLDREGAPDDSLARRKLGKEMEILRKIRDSRLIEANLRYVKIRVAALEKDDDYLRELFGSDLYRLEVRLHLFAAERAVLESEVDELLARLEKRWGAAKQVVLTQQKMARQQVIIARLEVKLSETLDELRWARNDLDSGVESRRRKAKESLLRFTTEKETLGEEIAEARASLKKLTEG